MDMGVSTTPAPTDSASRAARLRSWQVEEGRSEITPWDAARYALSIGIGGDPLDLAALRFVDPDRPDFAAFSSMALVLGYPGFWLGDERLGLGASNILHIEQSFELVRPLPLKGVVTGRTRIDDLRDRGPGRGSILGSTRHLLGEDGELIAVIEQKHLVRGLDGYAPHSPPAGERQTTLYGRPDAVSAYTTRRDQALLYRLNGDMNPLHADPDVARRAGYAEPILHGMCSFAIAAWAIARRLSPADPSRLSAMSARFTAPVVPGETLQTEIFDDGRFRTLIAERGEYALDAGSVRFAPMTGGTAH